MIQSFSNMCRNLGAFRLKIPAIPQYCDHINRFHDDLRHTALACARLERGKANAEKRIIVSFNIHILSFLSVAHFVYKCLNIFLIGDSHGFSRPCKIACAFRIALEEALLTPFLHPAKI